MMSVLWPTFYLLAAKVSYLVEDALRSKLYGNPEGFGWTMR